MFGRLLIPFFALGVLAVPGRAQTSDALPAQGTNAASPAPATTPSPMPVKKVWTNEELAGAKGGVSVVGDQRNKNYHMGAGKPADPATVARIKKNLEKLQSLLDDVNKKLQSYKDFQEGEPVSRGERDLSKGYSRVPVDQQVLQLLDKKKKLETQIGELNDEARKKGIDPGELR
jgi:hypothetical protein